MKSITIYTSSTCPHCKTAKDFLHREGLPFSERNVQTDPQAQQELAALGARGVPTFVIGDEVIIGFDPNRVRQAVDFKIQPCPNCGKKLKIPKDKGKIKVTCPDCKQQFVVKT